jgi:hypothetical protein
MKKPRKDSGKLVSWSVYTMRAKGIYLGQVEARDEAEARHKSRLFGVRASERWRLSVRSE